MSAVPPVASQTAPVRRGPLLVTAGVLAAIVVATVADAIIAAIAHAAGAPDDFIQLTPGPYIMFTTLGVAIGAIGWTIVRKVSKAPEALIRWLVPAVVVISFIPDFLLIGAGGAIGVTALLVMHVAVAAVAVTAYRKVMPLSA